MPQGVRFCYKDKDEGLDMCSAQSVEYWLDKHPEVKAVHHKTLHEIFFMDPHDRRDFFNWVTGRD